MLFNSYGFIFAFLPIAVVGYYSLASRYRRETGMSWLIICSLFFYGWWNPFYLGLLIFSIAFNFLIGSSLRRKQPLRFGRKPLLVFGIVLNLTALGYFKYANFFVENINAVIHSGYHLKTIVLPLAISFFTFQQIAYLVDTYRNETPATHFLDYCLFVSFFPQLIAGPIVHHKEMMPQFANTKNLQAWPVNLSIGIIFFSMGLFKKVVIADNLAPVADHLFTQSDTGQPLEFLEAWAAALSYTLQLYFDFSGYSDMAMGVARLFGIRLPINFDSPYKSSSIIEFWRRWHITLSRFLKEYLYFPLGGNRSGRSRRYLNLMVTMLLGGLWHGAGWTFVIWGGLHGVYLTINHGWRSLRRRMFKNASHDSNLAGKVTGWLLTSIAFMVGWVIFRADSIEGALNVLAGLVDLQSARLPGVVSELHPKLMSILHFLGIPAWGKGGTMLLRNWPPILCAALFLFGPNTNEIVARFDTSRRSLSFNKRTAFCFACVLVAGMINLNKQSAFLYFQF